MSNCLDQLRIIIKEKILFLTFFFLVVGCDGGFKAISSKVIIKFPKVVDIKLDSEKKLYGLGSSIGILIRFSHPVIVKSDGEKTPSITLSFIGLSRNAQYISGTGTKTLLFQYIVAVNDENSDLVEMGSTINLNGTSISSSSGNNAILDLKPIKIGGIDAIIPLSPSGLSLHDPLTSPSNDPTPEITVSGVEPFAKVEIFKDSSCNTSVNSSASVLQNESTVNIIASTITSEGATTYYARQTDQAGNESLCSSASLSYEYDGTRPARPSGLSLHEPLTSPNNDSTPEIMVSGVEHLAKVELFSDNFCSTSVSPQVSVEVNESTVNIIANTIASDSTVTYYARQTDQAGNESPCSSTSLSYQYDGTIPRVPIYISLHDPLVSPSNDATPEFSVFGVEPLATVELFSDSSCETSVSPQFIHTTMEPEINIIANTITSNSIVTYYARQTDQAGNESLCTKRGLSYEYDETTLNRPSGLSLHNPLVSPGNNPTPEITVSGVDPLAIVELFSDSSCETSISPQVSVEVNESTVNIIANTIASDSTVTYYARQKNQEGNESLCSSARLSYKYDGTIPRAPLILRLHDPLISPSNNPTPKINIFGVEIFATVELFSDSSCETSVSPRVSVETNDSTVNIIANAIASDSTVTYYARQTDQAGNESPCSSINISYEYDGTISDCRNFESMSKRSSNGNKNIATSTTYTVVSTYSYRMDINGLTAEAQQFEFCLSPSVRVTADLKQSYLTESNSLVWEGQVAGTPTSLAHQLGNSIMLVKRNNELRGTVWANGYLHRIWPLGGDLYKVQRLSKWSVLDQPQIITDLAISEANTDERIPEISVMIVFTSEANNILRDIYAFSDLVIAETNLGYRASGIKAKLKLAHAAAHSYNEVPNVGNNKAVDLKRIANPNDGYMDDVHELRNQHEADIVMLITSHDGGQVGSILSTPENAFGYVSYRSSTGVYTFAHEIGHLLGCKHDSVNSDGPYAFSHGYTDPNNSWRTIMAYPKWCDGCSRLNLWSNPNITILGEPVGHVESSDAARTINMNASAFASFYGETYADISGAGTLLQNNAVVGGIEASQGHSVLYAIEVPTSATNLRIETSGGSGDVDLYVKAKAMAVPGFYDCRSENYRNNEECVFESPEAVRYHVLLFGYTGFSNVTLRIQYDEPDS